MKSLSAILLAAGESRRMGETNKLTLDINNTPLLLHTAIRLLACNFRELVVVVGYEEETARKLLAGLPLTIVSNPNYMEGQMTSVHVGMSALKRPTDGVMVCLSDQPLLEVEDLTCLIDAFKPESNKPVLIPMWKGKRGNPIIINTEQKDRILTSDKKLGCKHITRNHPEMVQTFEVKNEHYVFDIDTPDDYHLFQSQQITM